jgi:hypothetical protein
MANEDKHCQKPQLELKLYDHKVKKPTDSGSTPKSSTKAPQSIHACENLTLYDWLIVVDYHDKHKPISQQDIVAHFAKRPEGALVFTQSSLSCHLFKKGWEDDQKKLASTPTALSAKRAHIVTWPDVEKALVLWVKHMEEKGETVTEPMLVVKCEKYENVTIRSQCRVSIQQVKHCTWSRFGTRQKANPCMWIWKVMRGEVRIGLTYSLKQGLLKVNLKKPDFTGERA